jgi:hypothetical protein
MRKAVLARLFNKFHKVGRVNQFIYSPEYGMLENPSFEVGRRIFMYLEALEYRGEVEDEEDEDPNDVSSETLKTLLAEEDIAPIAFYKLGIFLPHQFEYVAFTLVVDLEPNLYC